MNPDLAPCRKRGRAVWILCWGQSAGRPRPPGSESSARPLSLASRWRLLELLSCMAEHRSETRLVTLELCPSHRSRAAASNLTDRFGSDSITYRHALGQFQATRRLKSTPSKPHPRHQRPPIRASPLLARGFSTRCPSHPSLTSLAHDSSSGLRGVSSFGEDSLPAAMRKERIQQKRVDICIRPAPTLRPA
jgi:hypothetical protein